MPADSLFPSLILPSRLIELESDRLLVTADLGALFDLNGHTLTANLLSTGFGTVWVMGPGAVDGEVDITVADGKFIALTLTATGVALFAAGNAEDVPLLANEQILTTAEKSQVHQNLSLVPGTDIASLVAGKIPAGQLPTFSITDFIPVADQVERLGLNSADVYGKLVKQADNGRSYGLPNGSDASVNGDWLDLGDSLIEMSDVVGLPAALAAETAAREDANSAALTEIAQRDFIRGTAALGRLYSRLTSRATTGSASFTVAVHGDSYATAPITALRSLYGEVGYFSIIQPNMAFAGGAAPIADSTQSPSDFYVNLGPGQSVTYDNRGSGLLGSQLKALYQVLPTAGTFRILASVNGGEYTDVLTVDASVSVNGPEAAAMAVANVNPANLKIRIVGVTGQCRIIGLGIDFGALSGLANRHGIRSAQVNTGGTTPAQWNATPQHIFSAMYGGVNGLSPDIAFFKGDDGAAAWLADFPPLIAKIQAASPDTVIVVQGRHPTTADPSNTDLHADDIALMEMCEANGWLYIPSRLYFPPADEMQAVDLLRQNDGGVHLTSNGGFLQEDITLQWLGPIARGVWNLEVDSNARNKGFLHGYQGVSSTTPGVPLNFVYRGDMNLIGGQIGFVNLAAGTAANPGRFTGMEANPIIVGNDTHKGGLGLRVDNNLRQFINRQGRIISGGGNYNIPNITNSMNGAYTLLSGAVASDNGLVLGTVNSPHPSSSPLELRVGAGFNADGTPVMRMHNTTGKLRYLGSGSAAMTGAFTLVNGVATINTTAVETNDHINLTLRTPGGTMGLRYSVTIVNGVSFTITAVNATGATVPTDTSSGTWEIASGRL